MIVVKNVVKSFDNRAVLSGFSHIFPKSGAVCIFGPSGCGKTTLLNIILGLVKPDSGAVEIEKGVRLSAVFQQDRLFDTMTAAQNVAIVAPGKNEEKMQAAHKWLSAVELSDSADMMPTQLSGGMGRRVAIARALAYDAEVILMDEPFKGLDDGLKERICEKIKAVAEEKLVVIVTHDRRDAQLLCASSLEMEMQI